MLWTILVKKRICKPLFTRANHTSAKRISCDDFFRFSRGRFVCDEAHEMAQRQVEFNMNELCNAAAIAVGSTRCSNVEKCADGMYNKAFILTMEDGKQVVAKVPNPNAGRPHFTTASEVATMDFVRSSLGIPTPRVIAWSSSVNNAIGAEYIIMEKAKGIPLEQLWPTLDVRKRAQVVQAIARYLRTSSNKFFSKIGNLYYTNDLPNTDTETPLYVDRESGDAVKSDRFAVGPINAREWVDHGRGTLHFDRGPWASVLDYRRAMAHKEITAIRKADQLPKPLIMLCGPGLYQPTATNKLQTLDSFMKVLPYILPETEEVSQSCLWHDDLHAENIFVNPEDPSQILSIIDWQSVFIAPLFDHTITPAFLNNNTSCVHTMEEPAMPATYDEMSKDEQSIALRELYEKSLVFAFKIILQKHINHVFQALVFQESSTTDVLVLARRIFEIGEAHAMSSILDLRENWHELPFVKRDGNPPFPLTISDAEVAKIERDVQVAMESQEMMSKVKESLGDLFPEKGIVRHDQYTAAKSALHQVKAEILHQFAKNPQERSAWERAWPFDD